MLKQVRIAAFLGGVGSVVFAPAAMAADANGNASITVRQPVALTNTTDLAFGTVDAPTDATTTFVVATDGSTSTSGGNGAFATGEAAGVVTIAAENGQTIALSAAASTCTGATGVALTTITGDYNGTAFDSSAANTATFSSGTTTIDVGGSVTVDVGTTGAATCAYTVTVNYN